MPDLDMGADDASFEDLEMGASDGMTESEDFDMDVMQDNWDIPVASATKGNKKSTDQTENLDVEEGDLDGDGVKMKDKSKNKKEEDEELTDEELEAKETQVQKDQEEKDLEEEEQKPVGKLLPAKLGDKETTIDTGAVVRKKIDGKMVDVKISDALDAYAGKTSYDKRFKELSEKEKTTSATVEKVQKYEAHLKNEFGKISQLAKDALDGKAHPMEAVKYLLDNMGQDSFVYYKKTMETLFDEFQMLYDMTEDQQKAYWTGKENEHIKKSLEKTRISQQKEQADQQLITQVESAQKEFGVDWAGFNETLDYLLSLKDERGNQIYQEKNLVANPRAVAQYAAKRPFITKAQDLIKPFEENMADEDIVKIAEEVTDMLHKSKGADEAEILEWLETNYGVSKAVRLLNQKLKQRDGGSSKTRSEDSKYRVKTKPKAEDEIEDFDDFDF